MLASVLEQYRMCPFKRNPILTNVKIGSVPDSTLITIKKYREEGSEHSKGEVEAIVRVLEPVSTDLCTRLDARALVVICSVLVHTECCLAQQRGLYLLSVSFTLRSVTRPTSDTRQRTLYEGKTGSSQEVAERKGKKIAVGQQALIRLSKGFIDRNKADCTRRWVHYFLRSHYARANSNE